MLVLCDATVVLINHIHSAIQSLQNRFHLQLFTYMTLNKFTVRRVKNSDNPTIFAIVHKI